MSPIRYRIELLDLNAHLYAVRTQIAEPDRAGQVFTLPTWIRGSYLIRDFAKHIVRLRAECRGQPLACTRLDTRSLRCAPCGGPLELYGEVYAFDPSVRKTYLDAERGFFNPGSLCYRAVGADGAGCELELPVPTAPACTGWRVYTAADPARCDVRGWGSYRFADYAALLDHPFALGAQRRIDFAVDGIPHALVLAGDGAADETRLATDLQAICSAQRALFDHRPQHRRYVFLCQLTASGHGGLEHRNSAALVAARDAMPRPGEPATRNGYRGFLGLVSHEYFHQWNVKRITPRAFAESDLGRPAYSRDLWAYEGVTSYYGDLFLLRSGRIDAPVYLDLLAQTATRLQRSPGHAIQTLADASFEAWIKYYQPDEDSPNSTVSYYVKGALVALLLDLRLRRAGRGDLDTVMRALWARYGGPEKPAPEGALEAAAAECSGLDLSEFFDSTLRSTAPLPLAEALSGFGVAAELRPARGEDDPGGRHAGAPAAADLGLRLRPRQTVIAHLTRGGPAEVAGLAAGDQILAIDGERIGADNWLRRVQVLKHGEPVQVTLFRDNRLRSQTLVPRQPPADTWTFTLATVDGETAQRRIDWLGV
ncbi:MAG: M61 family metallopeptidase [Gammaproteobacteria bacterium]|nr:M61 family metallopeptidase [Gammaproteobacteria bacterium]